MRRMCSMASNMLDYPSATYLYRQQIPKNGALGSHFESLRSPFGAGEERSREPTRCLRSTRVSAARFSQDSFFRRVFGSGSKSNPPAIAEGLLVILARLTC